MRQPMKCRSCLDEFTPPTSNTKFCETCRVLRDLDFYQGNLKRKCTACESEFYPLRASWLRCPNCSVHKGTGEVECNLCHQFNETAPGLSSTCIFCISMDKKNLKTYWTSLQKLVGLKINVNQTEDTKRTL